MNIRLYSIIFQLTGKGTPCLCTTNILDWWKWYRLKPASLVHHRSWLPTGCIIWAEQMILNDPNCFFRLKVSSSSCSKEKSVRQIFLHYRKYICDKKRHLLKWQETHAVTIASQAQEYFWTSSRECPMGSGESARIRWCQNTFSLPIQFVNRIRLLFRVKIEK